MDGFFFKGVLKMEKSRSDTFLRKFKFRIGDYVKVDADKAVRTGFGFHLDFTPDQRYTVGRGQILGRYGVVRRKYKVAFCNPNHQEGKDNYPEFAASELVCPRSYREEDLELVT